MASRQATLQFFALLCIAAATSSFTLVSAEETSKSEEHPEEKDVSISDDSNQEDSKEKRSQEEIMFGNQQNKPSGLVDDLMGMTNNMGEDENSSSNVPDKKSTDSQSNEQETSEESGKEEKRAPDSESDMMMGSGAENWYNPIPAAPNAMQYLSNGPALKPLPSEDFTNGLYDQEDLYRRKRQLFSHPLPLRKRSLRSSLGQMIQKRGIRMPRRSMRLKRQVDMEDLLNLFGNERYFDEENQVTPHSFGGRARTVAKRHVPGRFGGYPETPAPEFRYPYVFQHREDPLSTPDGELDDNNDVLDGDNRDEIDNLMLLPPNMRYSDDVGLFPFRSREEENEAIQSWLSRHTTPSVFRVSRRSAPVFYPIDYRYIPAPGYKKRSRFSNGNRPNGHFSGEEEAEGDFGKWGHVVQVPEAYASPEDVARLYGLASLMAEGDDSEAKMRRST